MIHPLDFQRLKLRHSFISQAANLHYTNIDIIECEKCLKKVHQFNIFLPYSRGQSAQIYRFTM